MFYAGINLTIKAKQAMSKNGLCPIVELRALNVAATGSNPRNLFLIDSSIHLLK